MLQRTEVEERQFRRMTGIPVPRLVISLAIPTILSMLISAIYNMADTYFVARLGTSAAGAVGIVFAMMAIIQAIGFTLGMGSGSLVSRALGRQERHTADVFASSAFFLAAALGVLLAVAGLVFNAPLMTLLGATPTILPYASDYAHWIFFGAPVMCCSFVMNNLLRAEGKAVLAMTGLGFGGLLNIVLDPLFIFTFGLGISGAALATLLSQCISFSILLYCFLSGRSITTIAPSNISRHFATYADILKNGFPSFCRQGLASIATVALNVCASVYGDAAVAAMSIVGRIFLLILSTLLGFGQGFQPVAGYNYGAKRYDRVREAYFFCIKTGTIWLSSLGVVSFLFAPEIIAFFRNDPEVIAIGALAFRAQCLALPLQPLIIITNMLFQSLGKSVQATILALCRQGIFFLPLILILSQQFGLIGIQLTQSLSDVCSALSAVPFLLHFFRGLRRQIAAMPEHFGEGQQDAGTSGVAENQRIAVTPPAMIARRSDGE